MKDKTAIEGVERFDAVTKIASKALQRFLFGALRRDWAFETVVAHVNQSERCFAVAVKPLEDVVQELLAPLDEILERILPNRQAFCEHGIAEPARCLGNEPRM